MRKIIIAAGLIFLTSTNTAFAGGCPSGICEVEINCTTGVVTYKDAAPRAITPVPAMPEPIAPTHTISVQTTNQGWGTSGTPEQIAQAVSQLAPTPLEIDPCLNGGCTKIEVNATTKVTTVTALSESDLKQRAKDRVTNNKAKAELAKSAYQALPNITPWQAYDPLTPTPATEQSDIEPDWWQNWVASYNAFFQSMFWWWSM
jgi:hypothetical protein